MLDLIPFGEVIALGLGLASIGAALLIQCGGNKRGLPKKKAGQKSKSSSKSVKSKKSSRSGKAAGSKKSNKSKSSSRSQKKKGSSKKSSKKLSKTQSTSSKKAQGPKKSVTQVSAAPQREAKSESAAKPLRTYYSEQEWSKNLLNELHVEMRTLKFNAEGGSVVKLPVHNASKDRYAFKVKCSDNCLFRVSPVFDIIEPGSTIYINVSRCAAPSKQDRLVLETAKISDSVSDPRAVFQHHQEKFPKILLPMSA